MSPSGQQCARYARPEMAGFGRKSAGKRSQRRCHFAQPDRQSCPCHGQPPDLRSHLLEEQFDALSADPDSPLLNRATQGQYQPGMLLQPFVLAAALERELITLDQPVDDATDALVLDSRVFECATAPGDDVTWLDVLQIVVPAQLIDSARRCKSIN